MLARVGGVESGGTIGERQRSLRLHLVAVDGLHNAEKIELTAATTNREGLAIEMSAEEGDDQLPI